ncbi:unnamed protein product [Rotaria magnacalcarata]|uniref:Uncharacterized protein n=1 Tax=Rotaria magnacalcarata TaxID=392030 RepID=A0A820A020_9BILA|nr:unnamed protein product [Rotaria magnacalcarata]CAF3908798.1 unnamed protein product [Rotaria magnacalcarata]CAF4172145.1 unnamed protein product [Rotaria magnacalcarata]CAF4182057.1 unnamed protein product [Rotaria magnacalcarata]
MKWNKGATEGIVVAEVHEKENALNQLAFPNGLFVDTLGTLYVTEFRNDRVMRWSKGETQGPAIVGGNGEESGASQFNGLFSLSFDHQRNLYVVDYGNHRVQRFSITIIPGIPASARWAQDGDTVVGGSGQGNDTNKLNAPFGLFVDDDQMIVIADYLNNRIVQWKMGDANGQVVAGGNGNGNRLHQLNSPTDVLIDKETDSFIICDAHNRRVVRWHRRNGTKQGEIFINNIDCWGLTMNDQRYLYVSDGEKHEVRRYQIGDKHGTIVAGGLGNGSSLGQLNWPTYAFVDQQQTLYICQTTTIIV